MKKFHDVLKQFMVQRALEPPNFFADGSTFLADQNAILKRLADRFDSVLNRPSTINDNAINRLPKVECNVLLDDFPTVTETMKAIQHLTSDKAPGSVRIQEGQMNNRHDLYR